MKTNTRRGFLGLAGGIAAGMILDPDIALWIPGRRLISIPAAHVPEWVITDRIIYSLDGFGKRELQRLLEKCPFEFPDAKTRCALGDVKEKISVESGLDYLVLTWHSLV